MLTFYGMCPKISKTLFPTFWVKFLFSMHLILKIIIGMANSVDPDQTTDLDLLCLHMPFC